MRIAFFGTGEFGAPALRALVDAGHDVVAAVSQPDRPAGRGRETQATPIRLVAEALHIPHVQVADVNAEPPTRLIGGAELAVVVAFGQKIGAALLAAAPRGFVNLHASLLPRHRGAAPYQWAILSGDAITGVTIFQLNERWDAGPILGTVQTPIDPTETADELHDRLAQLAPALLLQTLEQMTSGSLTPQAQTQEGATRAPKLTRADGVLDLSASSAIVARRMRGLWSWPSVTAEFIASSGRRERLQLARAIALDEAPPTPERPVGGLLADGTLQCALGRVRLLEVRPAGGKLMTFEAFARGRGIRAGDRLEPIPVS